MKPTNNIIVVSDLHCGCKLGLCPPDGVKVDDGGTYKPSRLQLVVWSWWREFWDKWVPVATKGEPYDVVINGDAIEGVHHGATTPISANIKDQCKLAHAVLKPVADRCRKLGGRFYMVRGTEAHVGVSAREEEALAETLGAVASNGQHARWELWKRCGNGLVHFLHHVGTTSSSQHESSAVNAELVAEFVEAARWGNRAPDVVVRSHRHRCIEVRIPTSKQFATATTTPAWQLKTPHCYRVAGIRLAPPQIGGILIRHGDRQLYTEPWVRTIERSPAE